MFRSYFKIAVRNLLRNKGFSAINILGLTIGMASAILILLWVAHERSYDRFHKKGDLLHEAWNRSLFNGKLECWNTTPKILGLTLKQQYPQVAEVARTYSRWYVTSVGDKQVSSKALIADPSFLSLFSFPLVKGRENTALNSVYSIILTEKMAVKMFGTKEALNKIIEIDKDNFTVTGILRDLPTNTNFDFEYILPWAYLTKTGQDDTRWDNSSIHTYVELKEGVSLATANRQLKDVVKRNSAPQKDVEVFLHPITKWHLYSEFENGEISGGRVETVRLFALIAGFILLIACINFMNLSTAKSEKRAKEVGIRKVAGANKGLLVGQFLGESVLIALLSGALALLVVELALPSFTTLVSKELAMPYNSFSFWLAASLFVLLTGLVAGVYPAFFLSSFKPVSVLKGTFRKAKALIKPRKVLVVVQFTFAIVLIISTIVVSQQIRYAEERETGYNSGQLVYHWTTGNLNEKYSLLKRELLSSGIATSLTRTSMPLTDNPNETTNFTWNGKDPGDKTVFHQYSSDEDLVRTAGLKLVEGRDLNLSAFPTDSSACLLNESAVKAMNLKNPIGVVIKDGEVDWHVVGVVKDFVLESPFKTIRPMVIEGSKSYFNVINMKLSTAANTAQSLAQIEKIFKKFNPEYPFEYHFVNEDYARKFNDAERTGALTTLFAGLTIFISCLGLFALAAYMAESRIKEIGVRKVLGASMLSITSLLSKEFLSLVVVSLFIASPIGWYVMNTWLQGYSYRINVEWWVFIVAAVASLLIALITVSAQAIKAALSNPAKNLRTQ